MQLIPNEVLLFEVLLVYNRHKKKNCSIKRYSLLSSPLLLSPQNFNILVRSLGSQEKGVLVWSVTWVWGGL